ncbi:hypothetical protein ASG31_00855 [Chryseobacterium sp. Leaf404]|uniref:hypothetical protein n=1 Tax=unclassified Chryseobacterium TaxID=2593645 RepID=UPI0006F3659B|nr:MULTISPECIES: hypothetical protein [unclassified Chryseobacterium]KQT21925.1 hypothetical protein ASG31_00855 [Chryseobacterium sp. Leaf404]
MSFLFFTAVYSLYLGLQKTFKQQNFLAVYLCVSFLVEIFVYLKVMLNPSYEDGVIYQSYIIFSTAFMFLYLVNNKIPNLRILGITSFVIFLLCSSFFFYKSPYQISQSMGVTFSLCYIFLSLVWLFGKLRTPGRENILKNPKFWVASGLMFWGVFFILRIIPRRLFKDLDDDLLILSQSFFNIINIFFYLLFFIALLKYKNRENGRIR